VIKYILLLTTCITLFSCSVDYRLRKNKDIYLDKGRFKQLEGEFTSKDFKQIIFLNRFIEDTLPFKEFKIKIIPLTEKKIKIQCINQDATFLELELSGKFKKGYFKARTKITTKWIIGPLLWGLRQENRLIGITNDNKLVIINSGGGTGFILFMPFFASASQFDWEFNRNK
jgi:hypothetical protein